MIICTCGLLRASYYILRELDNYGLLSFFLHNTIFKLAFSRTVDHLGILTGAQLFSLNKEELKKVCGEEGARVYSKITVQKSLLEVRPLLANSALGYKEIEVPKRFQTLLRQYLRLKKKDG